MPPWFPSEVHPLFPLCFPAIPSLPCPPLNNLRALCGNPSHTLVLLVFISQKSVSIGVHPWFTLPPTPTLVFLPFLFSCYSSPPFLPLFKPS